MPIPGAGQPFADVIKLMFKEIIIPADAQRVSVPAGAVPRADPGAGHLGGHSAVAREHAFANIDAGLLYILALTSMGVYGIILAGWAANSKYAFLGRHALRGADRRL